MSEPWISVQCLTLEQHEDCPGVALFPTDDGAAERPCSCSCHGAGTPSTGN